jgi:hypothetical protein
VSEIYSDDVLLRFATSKSNVPCILIEYALKKTHSIFILSDPGKTK